MLCTKCNKWCQEQCSGLRNLRGVKNFLCPMCAREGEGGDGNRDDERLELVVNSGMSEEVVLTVLLLRRCAGL